MRNSCSIRGNYMFLYKHELPLIEHALELCSLATASYVFSQMYLVNIP